MSVDYIRLKLNDIGQNQFLFHLLKFSPIFLTDFEEISPFALGHYAFIKENIEESALMKGKLISGMLSERYRFPRSLEPSNR